MSWSFTSATIRFHYIGFFLQQSQWASCNDSVKQIIKINATRVEVPDSCPDFEGRAASGCRPKLHIRAESLSLESLDMNRAVGRESLHIPNMVAKAWTWVAKVCVQTFANHVQIFATKFWYVKSRHSKELEAFKI